MFDEPHSFVMDDTIEVLKTHNDYFFMECRSQEV